MDRLILDLYPGKDLGNYVDPCDDVNRFVVFLKLLSNVLLHTVLEEQREKAESVLKDVTALLGISRS